MKGGRMGEEVLKDGNLIAKGWRAAGQKVTE